MSRRAIVPRVDRPRVFLHVGSPKTGTTFLQNVLWSQRDQVRAQGILLPLTSLRDHHMAALDVRGIAYRAPDPERARGLWQTAVQETLAWPGTVLISHELLAGATAEEARRAVTAFGDGFEVHVVLTARDLIRQIPAEWQEHVKHRNSVTYQEFLERISGPDAGQTWFWRVQDFPSVLRRWGELVPAERTHLVTVPAPGAPPELLWQRFAGLIGLLPDAFDLKGGRSNTSLGVEQTELLRRFNARLGDRLPMPQPYPEVVKGQLAHRVLAQRQGTPLRLPATYGEFAIRRSDVMVKELAELGIDVVGDLADLVPGKVGDGREDVDLLNVSEMVLLEESLEAMIRLIQDHQGTRVRVREQAQRLVELEEDRRSRRDRRLITDLADRWRWLGRIRTGYRRLRYPAK